VNFPQRWAGSQYGQSSKVESYNFSPTIAYKLNDWISVAIGLQAQYMKVSYDAFINAAPLFIGSINGAGWGWGWTAGVTLTPTPTTTIGIGYRSAINQDINGSLDVPAGVGATTRGSVNTTINLPDTLTIGLRQRLSDRFTLLAGYEWSNWSRIGSAVVQQPNGATATIGGTGVVLPFQYSDGHFYSLGGEYILNPAWTLRAGIAFEKSPIKDAVRTPRLPDNDRMWYSVGASYKPASIRGLTLDAGYSYIDVKDTPICLGTASGCPANPWSGATTYIGSVNSNVHIVSVGLRYQWDDTVASVKQAYLK
jgi:long-chain fatty acid transport protein